MNELKTTLRTQLKELRLNLSRDDRQAKSDAITSRLSELIDWSGVTTMHYFEPIAALGEVDTTPFIAWIKEEQPHIRLYTTRRINEEWQVVSVAAGVPVPTASFGVVLVPMLGFDEHLHRIGYGGGYYDTLLTNQPQAQKVGVCFEIGKVAEIPTEAHDIPLDLIVTEVKTYQQ